MIPKSKTVGFGLDQSNILPIDVVILVLTFRLSLLRQGCPRGQPQPPHVDEQPSTSSLPPQPAQPVKSSKYRIFLPT